MTTRDSFDYFGTVELAYALLEKWKKENPYSRDRFPRYALLIDGQMSYFRFYQYLNALAAAYEQGFDLPIVVECQSFAEFMALLVRHNVREMILKGRDNFATDPWVKQQMLKKNGGYR